MKKGFILGLLAFCLIGTSCTPTTKDPYAESTYDFGDKTKWAGDSLTVVDLGDCIFDAYPYDERYDWGQSILYDSSDSTYKMWWCRHSRYDSIWYAESKDLKNWYNAQKVLVVEQNTTWIKMHVGKPSVIKVDGVFKMYFEAPATLKNGGAQEFDNNVMLATSTDGIHWDYYKNGTNEPQPVLAMTTQEMADSWIYSNEGPSGYGWYGLGQPSVCYVNGTYYMYHTHALLEGDRMYVSKSTDGIHFDRGEQVFVRAGCGVKYNVLTKKFMLAYEYERDGLSKVYYMESRDGVHFTYSSYIDAKDNKDVISRNTASCHGYPDFVCNELGQVDTYTVYSAFMEGKHADSGCDWRQYSSSWDIHISAFNPKEFANRALVLPNHRVYNTETVTPYKKEHIAYETKTVGISKTSTAPTCDGVKDSIYTSDVAVKLDVDRTVCENCAVPGDIKGTVYTTYDANNLYIFAEVKDKTQNDSDQTYFLIDEKKYAKEKCEVSELLCKNGQFTVVDGEGKPLANVQTSYKKTADGYDIEIVYPWRYKTQQNPYEEVGFDCYVYDNKDSREYSSIKAWNDFKIRKNVKNAGSLYFKKGK